MKMNTKNSQTFYKLILTYNGLYANHLAPISKSSNFFCLSVTKLKTHNAVRYNSVKPNSDKIISQFWVSTISKIRWEMACSSAVASFFIPKA